MKLTILLAALLAASPASASNAVATPNDPLTKPIVSTYSSAWLTPQRPVNVFGNTYYVGFGGLSIALIKADAGLILVDGALPQSVADIKRNIRTLGFDPADIKYILNTEAHFDHAAGIAALARDTGATVVTSAKGLMGLRAGIITHGDPQEGDLFEFPPVAGATLAMADGAQLRLGDVVVTAHHTPGHTPGSTTWSWRSCEGSECRDVVFGASLNALSAGDFKYTAHPEFGDQTPQFRRSIDLVRQLPCDILIPAHPDNSNFAKNLSLISNSAASRSIFVDSSACINYADRADGKLDAQIAKEKN